MLSVINQFESTRFLPLVEAEESSQIFAVSEILALLLLPGSISL